MCSKKTSKKKKKKKKISNVCPAEFQNCYGSVTTIFLPFFLFLIGVSTVVFLSLAHHCVLGVDR